jgi:hypothetical protein
MLPWRLHRVSMEGMSARTCLEGTVLAVALAMSACASPRVLRDFTTDGCSLFPDSGSDACWADCCVDHDRAYWRGGTAEERRQADARLRECVKRVGKPTLASLMYRGVRLGGMPLWPTWFRWGYGWGYGRGYEPLTPDEQQQAGARLATHRLANPQSSCAVEQPGER